MKAYPTVADLPDDVRARFSGDALEVYRAADNISYAYDGHEPEMASLAQPRSGAARRGRQTRRCRGPRR